MVFDILPDMRDVILTLWSVFGWSLISFFVVEPESDSRYFAGFSLMLTGMILAILYAVWIGDAYGSKLF